MGLAEDAYRYAVKNAALHGGKASIGAVVGKVKALHKNVEVKDAMPAVIEAVKKVNSMKMSEIEKAFAEFEKKGYELKPKEKEGFLPELDWAEKEKVVTRFAPNPNGPFHLGNARAAILSDEFAKMYNGKMILRFDDTDPKIKKPIENAEQIFKEDLEWLGCEIAETYFASDRLEIYYRHMKELIEKGKAYVCICESESWRKKIRKSEACNCRNLTAKKHMELFEKMQSNELKEGEAVLRIKTDLKHLDPSIRDWWAAKVVDKPVHPNPKASDKHVWPSYNLASAIDDHEFRVTLILRGQEHEQNKTKQEFLYKYFGWKYPHSIHFGRVKLAGMVLSTSKIKEGIEKGEFSGWDDPRLGTIKALRRRGFQSQALRNAILEIGVKSSDSSIDTKRLADLNKEELGVRTSVNFFTDPILLEVEGTPHGTAKFFISKKDLDKLEVGKAFRLRETYAVKLNKKDPLQAFGTYSGDAKIKPIIKWLEASREDRTMAVRILMQDNTIIDGITDEFANEVKPEEVIWLYGFGFCRIESLEEKKAFLVFAHA